MKCRYLFGGMLALLFSQNILSKECGIAAAFEGNYIKCRAKKLSEGLPRCGSFTLRPTGGSVRVQAQKFKKKTFGSTLIPDKVVSWDEETGSSWVKLPAGGLNVRFGRPGIFCKNQWRIFCTNTLIGEPQIVNCEDVVSIDDSKFPVRCPVFRSKYSPLNLRASAEERSSN